MVFLFIIIGLAMFVILFINSKIKIDVKQIKYNSRNKVLNQQEYQNSNEKQLNENNTINSQNESENQINIKVKLIILGFLPIFWQTINNKKIEEAKHNKKLQERYQKILAKIKNNKNLKITGVQALKIIKENIDIRIKKFNLNLFFAIEDAVATSLIVPIMSTILTILFYKKNVAPKKQKYKIVPMYNSRKFNKYIIFRYI